MLEEKITQEVVNNHEEKEILDAIVDSLATVQFLLTPTKAGSNLDFNAGVAAEEVARATKVLRALREKKYGQKPPTVL